MDRLIRRLGGAMLALFVVLLAQVTYIQVVDSERLADNPANATRQLIAEYRVDRGKIVAADERTVLALSRKSPGELKYQRHYPQGALYADLTGYYSIIFGRSELEQSYNTYLSGDAPELIPQTLIDQVLGRPKRGATVVTTIDPAIRTTSPPRTPSRSVRHGTASTPTRTSRSCPGPSTSCIRRARRSSW